MLRIPIRKLRATFGRISIKQNMNTMMIEHVTSIFLQSVEAVSPDNLVKNALKREGNLLSLGNETHELQNNVFVIGFGKAVCGMCRAVQDLIGDHIADGAVSIPVGLQRDLEKAGKSRLLPVANGKIRVFEGAENNLPDERAAFAARAILKVCTNATDNDLVIALISGGGSSLLPMPIPPISLEEKCKTISILAAKGASIQELNIVRQQLSDVKGGKLLSAIDPAKTWGLIISDIIGDPIDLIASGPTIYTQQDSHSALKVCERHHVLKEMPESVKKIIADSPNQKTISNKRVANHVIGSNLLAVKAALGEAKRLRYRSVVLSTTLHGEAKDIGKFFAELGRYARDCLANGEEVETSAEKLTSLSQNVKGLSKAELDSVIDALVERGNIDENFTGFCIIGGGESTVTLQKCPGKGGRNQEMVLSAAIDLYENRQFYKRPTNIGNITFLSAGTDGQDGPTPAAGAVISSEGLQQFDIHLARQALSRNDSYSFFENNGIVVTGLTSTNVMDIHVLLVKK